MSAAEQLPREVLKVHLAQWIREKCDASPVNKYPTEWALAEHLVTKLAATGYDLHRYEDVL